MRQMFADIFLVIMLEASEATGMKQDKNDHNFRVTHPVRFITMFMTLVFNHIFFLLLPTIYFKGLDNLIVTARSNKVAVLLGFQDFSQLTRDYGDKEAKVVMNTVGNIFSGQVVGETAKNLSERFGKVLQKRQSMIINRNDKSTSISTQLDSLIPASKISTLTQGMFVGAVADNFDERIEQKIFHAEIVADNERVKRETANYKKIPVITNFVDEDGVDRMQEMIQENYDRIKAETRQIVEDELERIKNDPILCHLLPEQG